MVDAIGDGKGPAALVQEIAKAEARIKEIEAELARAGGGPGPGRPGPEANRAGRGEQLKRFADLLRGNVLKARQALKKLLVDRVHFRPVDLGNGRQTYAFKGELTYGPSCGNSYIWMVSPAGYDGLWKIEIRGVVGADKVEQGKG